MHTASKTIQLTATLLLLTLCSCASESTQNESATSNKSVQVVASDLGSNNLNIETGDLRAKENPKGEGTFVYVPQTRFSETERNIVWLVIDNQAFPLNGATKNVISSLSWPRDAPEETWSRTNLNAYMATEAIEIVFGSQ